MRRVAAVADSRAAQSRSPRAPPPSSATTSMRGRLQARRKNTCGRWRSAAGLRSPPRPAWRSLLGRIEQRKHDADTLLFGAGMDRMPEHDVADRKAAVPEQNALVVALASGLCAADDLADLGVDVIAREPSTRDQRMERAAVPALRPVVDHELVHAERKFGI